MDVLATQPLPLAEWLSVVEREYLSGFVPAGGASVKLAILDDAAFGPAADRLIGLGRERSMLTVHVDAAQTRVHLRPCCMEPSSGVRDRPDVGGSALT